MLDATTHRHRILTSRGRIAIPAAIAGGAPAYDASLATVAANLTYYGYALSAEAYAAFARLDETTLTTWWVEIEVVLAGLSGADRKMEQFVVYKNFPVEVLAMDEVDYWTRQILMYWGLPVALFAEAPLARPLLTEQPTLKVLHLAGERTLAEIFDSLLAHGARWVETQWEDVQLLVGALDRQVGLDELPFVENRIKLAAYLMEKGATVKVGNATDVLRLAVGLSAGDVSLREPCKLRNFKRRERRALLGMLESATQLDEDIARRSELFKRLLHALHPGDYRDHVPKVVAAYDRLYKGDRPPTFASQLEHAIARRDRQALALLRTRPGDFARRLHAMLLAFGPDAARAFGDCTDRLTTLQLVRLHRYFSTVDSRETRMFPPRGDWHKVQIVPADNARRVPASLRGDLLGTMAAELARRLNRVGPVALAPEVARVKLPTNDAELSTYTRGTVFPIPPNIRFLRTASYWKTGPGQTNIWFDNGWNFHDASWAPVGSCAWNAVKFHDAAVFSGDPTNKHELEGRACQMIDLYLDKLAKRRVRYAVWTVLCYSRMTFAQAIEVFGALQWGEAPEAGNLFEPKRVQLAFPIEGDSLTKFVAMIDLERRELTFLDANLPARTTSAAANGKLLARNMPAFVEYLDSLPSVHDLFAHAPQSASGMPVLYDDASRPLAANQLAYVFRSVHQESVFQPFDLGSVLS